MLFLQLVLTINCSNSNKQHVKDASYKYMYSAQTDKYDIGEMANILQAMLAMLLAVSFLSHLQFNRRLSCLPVAVDKVTRD